jgi:glycosyltransferase involved in cell wall biosynthesis
MYFIGQLGLGGSERQLYLLLKHMNKTKFELHVVVFNPSENCTLDDNLRKEGVKVYAVPSQMRNVLSRTIWIYNLVRSIRPHIIHSWSIHDNIYAGIVGLLAGIRIRLGSIRDSLMSKDFMTFHPFVRWLILHSVQGHLVNSDAIAEELRAQKLAGNRIFTLMNCVEPPVRHPIRLEGMPTDARVVGMVGNLRSKKNYPMFVDGMAKIIPSYPDVYGLIVGQPIPGSDKNLPNDIQDQINSLGVENRIRMLGFHPNIPAVLPNFYAFCLTSNFEGTPNVILEAMMAGLPVIATRVGGIPQLVFDGVNGFLVDPGDVQAFANSLVILLNDPNLARQMGTAGRQYAMTEFGCETIVPRFEEYYLNRQNQQVSF